MNEIHPVLISAVLYYKIKLSEKAAALKITIILFKYYKN